AIELGSGISDMTGGVHDRWRVQVVTVAHGVVIRVMRWGDFDGSSAIFRIDVVISVDFQLVILTAWVMQLVVDEVSVALVYWVHGNSNVTQHGLNTRGGNHHVWLIVIERAVA